MITFDNQEDHGGNGIFREKRSATVVITEPVGAFREEEAKQGIHVNAADREGNTIEEAYSIGTFVLVESDDPGLEIHTVTITFEKDACYDWSIEYMDASGTKKAEVDVSGQTAPFRFTIDTTPPRGTLHAESAEGDARNWECLRENVETPLYSREGFVLTSIGEDEMSEIESVTYHIESGGAGEMPELLTEAGLAEIEDWESLDRLDLRATSQAIVYLKVVDMAGNVAYVCSDLLIVEDQAPQTSTFVISEGRNGFYSSDVKVRVSVQDPVIDGVSSGLRRVAYQVFDRDGEIPNQPTWEGTLYLAETDGEMTEKITSWNGTITIDASRNHSNAIQLVLYAEDFAGNIADTSGDRIFQIDTTRPVITVSFDEGKAMHGSYYSHTRTATVEVEEANFSEALVSLTISGETPEGKNVSPEVSAWTKRGKKHIASIVFKEDAKYSFGVTCEDLAGNAAESVFLEPFVIDQTAPKLTLSGISEQGFLEEDVALTLSYEDDYLDKENVRISISGAKKGSMPLVGRLQRADRGGSYLFAAWEDIPENDDIYQVKASVSDLAGNTSEKSWSFTINRFGSSYVFEEATEKRNGTFASDTQDVMIRETNASMLSDIQLTLFKDQEAIPLQEGEDYIIQVQGGEEDWFEYTYQVFEKNFEEDGVYRLSIHSKDEAGNIAENTLDTKEKDLAFAVDKTAPTIQLKNLKDNQRYEDSSLEAHFSAEDNVKLSEVIVKLDGKEEASWRGEELERMIDDGKDFSVVIAGDKKEEHQLEVIAVDAAGNQSSARADSFVVYKRSVDRIGMLAIAASVGLVAGVICYHVTKKRK
ncbi:MAG: Ig-like domain repeat protein [Lachnospiraceae bacterium]|nr:Ig-like domain repeat protein [Lachnospiraceae bacterium]